MVQWVLVCKVDVEHESNAIVSYMNICCIMSVGGGTLLVLAVIVYV